MAELTAGEPEKAAAKAEPKDSEFSAPNIKIALACLAGMVVAYSTFVSGAMALLQIPLIQEFHWKSPQIMLALPLMSWPTALFMPLLGRYFDKVGARKVLIGAAVGISLVTFALAFTSSNLLYFYGCFVVLGVLGASVVGYYKIISATFSRHRGKAFALFTVESTLIAAVMPLFLNAMLEQWGWRAIFVALAAIKLFVAVPILIAWLRDPAEEARKSRAAAEPAVAAAPAPVLEGLTLAETLRSAPFWMLILANLGGGMTIFGLIPNLIKMASDQGIDRTTAVWALSFMALFNAAGQFSAGFAIDKIHSPKVAGFYLCLFPFGLFLLSYSSGTTGVAPLLLGMALMGIGGGAQNPMQSYFITRFFGLKAFAEVQGMFRAVQAIFTAPAPWIVAMIHEGSGSYAGAYLMFTVGAALSITMFMLMPRYRYAAGR
jgi:MFS family permease